MRNLAIDYKGFYITLEIRTETIYAFWCNDEFEDSRRFSGYSIEEIKDFIFDDINARATLCIK